MQGEHREQISRGRTRADARPTVKHDRASSPRAAIHCPAWACPSASYPSPGVALVEAPAGVPARAGVRGAKRRGPPRRPRRSSFPRRRAAFCLQDELYTVCPLPWTFRIYEPVLQRNDRLSDTRVGCASGSGVRRVTFVGRHGSDCTSHSRRASRSHHARRLERWAGVAHRPARHALTSSLQQVTERKARP
jgi:hypothetical protein